ncbi:hypothetical protein DPMN_099128 [Dreissena polymorpha]|uniref:Uncharacterized protein n=1 Tax=Dreissena polymorpha TaxID=45954 RepID=A0A9D4LDK6_DREPO|nr:hypothetical protein DPMN_099128 [Dreissena polymorpha]
MFIHNPELQHVDLSSNCLTGIHLKFDHLIHLQMMNIHISLGTAVWSGRNKSIVLLHENPLECNCDRNFLRSIEWIEYSGFGRINETMPFCTLDHKDITIYQSA